MSIRTRIELVCDYQPSKKPHPHEATLSVEVRVGDVHLKMDLCEDDKAALLSDLTKIGMDLSRARVGPEARAGYVSASGKPFTTRDVRVWLRATGYEVSDSGRLTDEMLALYAESH